MATTPHTGSTGISLPRQIRTVHPLAHATREAYRAYGAGTTDGDTQPTHGVSFEHAVRAQLEMADRQLQRLAVQLNDGLAKLAQLADHFERVQNHVGAIMREMDGLRLVCSDPRAATDGTPTQTAQRHT